jgi:hypothetical protein
MKQARAPGPDTPASDMRMPHAPGDFVSRALLLWPRLDRRRLRRIGEEPVKIARLVARRTNLSVETIHAMIVGRVGAAGGTVRTVALRRPRLAPLGRTPPDRGDAPAQGGLPTDRPGSGSLEAQRTNPGG